MPAHRKDFSVAVKMYESGKSIDDCASFYRVTRQSMHVALKRRNVKFRPNLRFGNRNHFYRTGNEQDLRVRQITMHSIRNGVLVKGKCEVCGELKTEAHHDDYNKPLSVKWLCKQCHYDWHSKNEPVRRTIELAPMDHKTVCSMGGKKSWENRERNLKMLQRAREAHWNGNSVGSIQK